MSAKDLYIQNITVSEHSNHSDGFQVKYPKEEKTSSSAVPGTQTWNHSFVKRVCYQLSYLSEWQTEKK